MHAKKWIAAAALFICGFTTRADAQDKSPMKLVATTPLPGFTGDFDRFAVDLKGKRLFLSAEDHKTVEVFDFDGKRIKSISGFGQPHAILFMSDVNKFIVTDGDGFGAVELVSGEDYKILDTIKLPSEVDGAVYNPVNKYYFVESGGGEKGAQTHKINIIDTKAFKLVGDITLPGTHSEAMAITADGKKMFVNLSTPKEVGVVDLTARQLTAQWPITGAETPNSMALDEPHHRLFIATRTPPKMCVFDTDRHWIFKHASISQYLDRNRRFFRGQDHLRHGDADGHGDLFGDRRSHVRDRRIQVG
jgi:hypothetical protein